MSRFTCIVGLCWSVSASGAEGSGGEGADVVATRLVARTPTEVIAAFSDLRFAAGLFDGDCLRSWALGEPTSGVGSRARVTYVPGPMIKRTTLEVTEVVPGVRVTWDHVGARGFVTQVLATATDNGTLVTLHTFLEEPPWIVRHAFHQAVKPDWAACYEDALARLDGPTGLPQPAPELADEPEPPPAVRADLDIGA